MHVSRPCRRPFSWLLRRTGSFVLFLYTRALSTNGVLGRVPLPLPQAAYEMMMAHGAFLNGKGVSDALVQQASAAKATQVAVNVILSAGQASLLELEQQRRGGAAGGAPQAMASAPAGSSAYSHGLLPPAPPLPGAAHLQRDGSQRHRDGSPTRSRRDHVEHSYLPGPPERGRDRGTASVHDRNRDRDRRGVADERERDHRRDRERAEEARSRARPRSRERSRERASTVRREASPRRRRSASPGRSRHRSRSPRKEPVNEPEVMLQLPHASVAGCSFCWM